MDLLDSILSNMEKPPVVERKPVSKDKEKQAKFEKMQKERQEAIKKQKEALDKFRKDFDAKLRSFINTPTSDDPKTFKLCLKPMPELYRSIVRAICDEYELDVVVHSFGTEDVDRHCIVWRKGYEPCEEEIRAMKFGVEYKPKTEEQESDTEANRDEDAGCSRSDGKDKFWSKYEKIIGEKASGVESARVVLPAKQYGCVPIENKKDLRSIEQIMNDRKSKKQKISDESEPLKQEPEESEPLKQEPEDSS